MQGIAKFDKKIDPEKFKKSSKIIMNRPRDAYLTKIKLNIFISHKVKLKNYILYTYH